MSADEVRSREGENNKVVFFLPSPSCTFTIHTCKTQPEENRRRSPAGPPGPDWPLDHHYVLCLEGGSSGLSIHHVQCSEGCRSKSRRMSRRLGRSLYLHGRKSPPPHPRMLRRQSPSINTPPSCIGDKPELAGGWKIAVNTLSLYYQSVACSRQTVR